MIEEKIPEHLRHAPLHLSETSREFFEQVCNTKDPGGAGKYDAPARVLVIHFLEQQDLSSEAREHVAKEGAVFRDRWGQPRENPWVGVNRQATREVGRLFHLLGWDLAPPDQMSMFGGYSRRD